MTRINTNVESLRGLRNIQKSNKLLNTSLQRLSTGLKINEGKDNPSGLIASEALRLQISTIEQSIKNSNRAANVISTADSALGEIGGLLAQVRGLVQEGLNVGALSQEEIEANQAQIDAALSAINRIASTTSFAGDKLLDGSKAFNTVISTADAPKIADYKINQALLGNSSSISVNAEITTAAERGVLFYNAGDLTGPVTLEVGGTRGNEAISLGGSSTVSQINTAINAVSGNTGVTSRILAGRAQTIGSNSIVISDRRPQGASGNISIQFVDPGASGSLSVSVTSSGGNYNIVVNLAHDGTSVTSTFNDIKAALDAHSTASQLVSTTIRGSGSQVAAALSAGNLTVAGGSVLALESEEFGSHAFVNVNVLSGTFNTTLNDGNTTARRDTGVDIGARINGQAVRGQGLTALFRTNSVDAEITFANAYNAVGTTAAITVTGGGSVFQIGQQASVSGQIGIGIEAVNTSRLGGLKGKLYELGSGGGKSLIDLKNSLQGSGSFVDPNDLVQIIEDASNYVSTLRGRLGAVQKNVIETNVSNLGVALENISEARSQITDTDFAEETAQLQKAQILSQAGISVLSIANQNPQQVLSLLR
ncbi:MAG: flagellin [Planctomycetaceae bacterium]|nr:MAG: flagellin [Planctomycetaceae bacterium]